MSSSSEGSHSHENGRCSLCEKFFWMEGALRRSEESRQDLTATVAQLQSQLTQMQTTQQNSNIVVARLEDKVSDTLGALQQQFEDAMSVQTPRRRGKEPIGHQLMRTKELATQNAQEVSDLFEKMSDKSKRIKELEDTVGDLKSKVRNLQAVAENITGKTIENIQQSQLQVHDDLVALQQLVARKVDRREMTLLQSALQRLDSFTKLEQQLREDFKSLSAADAAINERLDSQDQAAVEAQSKLDDIKSTVQRLPKREEIITLQKSLKEMIDSGLRTLLKRVNLLHNQNTAKTKDNSERIRQLMRGSDSTGSQLATFEEKLQKALDGKVSLKDMDKYINQIQNEVLNMNAQRTEDIDQVCQRINADAKKNNKNMTAYVVDSLALCLPLVLYLTAAVLPHRSCSLRSSISNVEDQLTKSESKMKILMRFVDWYAENGQNFQHNADLVERQLESLAHRSAPGIPLLATGGRKPSW